MSMNHEKFLFHTILLSVALSAALIAPACSIDDKSSIKNTGGSVQYSVSTYDAGTFGGTKCSPPSASATVRLAFAEGTNGLQCKDNWVTVDPNKLQDVESGTERERLGGSDWQIFQNALTKCPGGICARIVNGNEYQLNLPHCWLPNKSNHCDGKVYEIKNSQGKVSYGFSHSICPARHWKNVLKAAMGYGSLHCENGSNHVDIGYNYGGSVKSAEGALSAVGLSSQSEKVTIRALPSPENKAKK